MEEIKKKKCRSCGTTFTPYRTTDTVCSSLCAKKYKESKEKKKAEASKEKKQTERKQLLETARLIFNRYIRERDKGKRCICCDKPLGADFQAGHYFSGGGHSNVLFDEENVHGQRYECNVAKSGNNTEYGVRLERYLGEAEFELLRARAYEPKRWEVEELKRIITTYKAKYEELVLTSANGK